MDKHNIMNMISFCGFVALKYYLAFFAINSRIYFVACL